MELGAGKAVEAGDVGHLGPVELANRADYRVGGEGVGAAILAPDIHPPDQSLLVPHRRGHFLVEADLVAQTGTVGIALDIGLDLVALGEEMVPVGVVVERVGIEVVGRVHANAGIGILVPGAANLVVLLDDGEGDAGFLELDAHADAREARADQQNVKIG